MAGGGLTNNPIELLITLGVADKTSKANITQYIADLKTQLGKLDIDVTFKNKNSNFAKDIVKEFEEIKKKAKEAEDAIAGTDKPKKKRPKMFEGTKDEVIDTLKSVKDLESYLKGRQFKYKIEMSIDKNGREKVKRIVADMKNDLGQIERVYIKPVVDKNGETHFKQYAKSLNDTSTYKLREEIDKAIKTLDHFKMQGRLTSTEYDKFKKSIQAAPDMKALNSALDTLKTKEKNAGLSDKLAESFINTGLKADELKNKMDRLERTNGSNLPAKRMAELRKEIEKILKMPIGSIADASKVTKMLNGVEKQIGYASMSAGDTKKFKDTLGSAREEIEKIQKTGMRSEEYIAKLYARLARVPVGELDQLNKHFGRLQAITKGLTDKKFVMNGIEQNTLNVLALNAQLERSVNLNRKYIDSASHNKLQGEISALANSNARNRQEVEANAKEYKRLNGEVTKFHSAATQASRNSMTVMNAFKVAMERFPIDKFYQIQVGVKLFELLETP